MKTMLNTHPACMLDGMLYNRTVEFLRTRHVG